MPNWSDNDLTVIGPAKDVEEMLSKAWSPSENDEHVLIPDFNKIIPYPEKYAEPDRVMQAAREKWEKLPPEERAKAGFPMGKDGFNSGGYEWCIQNWGTKWYITEGTNFYRTDGAKKTQIKVTFETAWSPPRQVILALAKAYPSITFSMRSYEMGMGWKRHLKVKGEEVLVDNSSKYSGNRGG
jgi:hypothetical protein